ncbi:hypothetical protein C8R43DRAFT_1015448 [Mycena crocata]|nr:hypothetical protein C8R43DRAFT_1015448 [Mycena crocata]
MLLRNMAPYLALSHNFVCGSNTCHPTHPLTLHFKFTLLLGELGRILLTWMGCSGASSISFLLPPLLQNSFQDGRRQLNILSLSMQYFMAATLVHILDIYALCS